MNFFPENSKIRDIFEKHPTILQLLTTDNEILDCGQKYAKNAIESLNRKELPTSSPKELFSQIKTEITAIISPKLSNSLTDEELDLIATQLSAEFMESVADVMRVYALSRLIGAPPLKSEDIEMSYATQEEINDLLKNPCNCEKCRCEKSETKVDENGNLI